jgi:hypothetical protein
MPVKSVQVELFRGVIRGELQQMSGRDVLRVTMKVLNRGKALTPVDTGNLRSSHQFRMKATETRQIGEVFTRVKYALAVHEGRRAVVIRPKKKQALAFTWHGQPMVRKWVYQPARPGRPWLRDALREVAAQEGYKMQSGAAADAGGGDL